MTNDYVKLATVYGDLDNEHTSQQRPGAVVVASVRGRASGLTALHRRRTI